LTHLLRLSNSKICCGSAITSCKIFLGRGGAGWAGWTGWGGLFISSTHPTELWAGPELDCVTGRAQPADFGPNPILG